MLAAAGCGDSDKPAYCADRTDLESSVKGLTSAASSGGVSGVEDQLTKIGGEVTALVDSAKEDFPTETSAMKSSIDALESAVKELPDSPSAADVVAIGSAAAAVVNSVTSFVDASKSECS